MYVYLLLVISEHSSGLTLGQLLQPLFSVPLVIIHLSSTYPTTVLPHILHRLV